MDAITRHCGRLLARRAALALLVVPLLLAVVGPVLAHGGRAVAVFPPVAQPGMTVNVQGSVLWTEQPVTVFLLAIDGTQWPLGEGATDGTGGVSLDVVVPDGLPDATYSVVVRAIASGEDAHGQLILRSSQPPLLPLALAVGAVLLVVAFTAAVVVGRRRRIDPTIG